LEQIPEKEKINIDIFLTEEEKKKSPN